jgi:hypothetical protein
MRWLPSLALAAAVASASAQSWTTNYASYGQLIVTQFITAPFPHPSRAAGHWYKDKFFPADKHYSDRTVAIFRPREFRATGPVDVVVHFHGWGNSVAGTLQRFAVIEQFTASRRNAILVVPEGPREASDSAGGKLEDPGGFARFTTELEGALSQLAGLPTNTTLGRIILSGHSGGYRVMAAILERGGSRAPVREAWLFDALYAETDKFLAWAERSPGRLLNIYTDHGGTRDDSEAMMKLLSDRGIKFLKTEDALATRDELATNRFVFLHTDLSHNDVFARRQTFQLFLERSCLAAYPPK